MEVLSQKKTDKNIVELEIKVDAKALQAEMDNVFEKESKDITIPGFRKGKAPRKIIEKRFGTGVFIEDAVNNLYPNAYSDAIKETGIEPVAPGDVEILEVSPEDGFTFKAIVTVKPEVTVKDYKGIEAEKEIAKVTDEMIEGEIEKLRERNSRLVEVADRPAEDGDTAIIDFEGFVDDVAFEGGKGENHNLVLGSHSFIDGFEDQIIGKNIGEEFDVNVTFPEEYHAEELAGKPAVFKVKLNELKATELPELDDEFVIDVSEFDTLDELKADIKTKLEESAQKMAEDKLENALVDKVIENLEGDIPEVMYEVRIDDMVHDFSHRLQHQGMTLELYLQYTGMALEDFRKTFREQAERQVKIRLALEKIVELEEIVASEEDLDEEYKNLAEMYGMEEKQIRDIIPAEGISADVAANKAIDLIKETAKVTEVEPKAEDKE